MSTAAANPVNPPPAANDFARTVKEQADIVKIIGDYVRLSKAGAQNWRGLCPFHKEKSPSFTVHATQGFYHCFGCHESGDVFTFVQKLENVSFPEALRVVAGKVGIALPKRTFNGPEEAKEARQRAQLIEMHEVAAQFFQNQLQTHEGSRARQYLADRELPANAVAMFGIGYAPDSFTALRDLLKPKYDEALLRLSGLFGSRKSGDGGRNNPGTADMYDRFRKRITFPIRNEQGKVIAFTARALETNEKAGPKYLNSPETPLYTKGNVLFNLDLAKESIRRYDFALLVEGQMDCIRAATNKVPNVLATSGTAFTETQVRLLGRLTRQVVVNFDPDTAGANAAEKSIAMLVEEGFAVKVLTLPDGLDPDRFIRERGPDAYVALLKATPRYTEYLIERARTLFPPRTAENKVKAVNFLLPHMRRIQSAIARDEFAADVAQKLGVDTALLRQELKQAASARNRSGIAARVDPTSESENALLRALMLGAADPMRQAARRAVLSAPHLLEGIAAGELLQQLAAPEAAPALHTIACSDKERAMLARLMLDPAVELTLQLIEDSMQTLEERHLKTRQKNLRAEIAAAERSGDDDAMRDLSEEKMEIDRRIREL